MNSRMALEATAQPAPIITFAQALKMIDDMQIEMDPEAIRRAEQLELGEQEVGT